MNRKLTGLIAALLIFQAALYAQVPSYYKMDKPLSDSLKNIVASLGLDKSFEVGDDGQEQISLAVIDLNSSSPVLGGVNAENLIYPASVYKMYVAAQIFSQVSRGEYPLQQMHIVKEHNAVDRSREIRTDPRPLLKAGDTVTVNYLLDLMITRSDNSAANCLIDVATRPRINEMMKKYGWTGSEVTRKFLKRKFEDPGYDTVASTMTCALHAADFMYKIYTNTLENPWVSMQMKSILGRQLDKSKLASGLPINSMFYHKTGWFSYWTNDVGIVDDGELHYVIACFTPVEEELVLPKLKELSSRIYSLMKNRLQKRS